MVMAAVHIHAQWHMKSYRMIYRHRCTTNNKYGYGSFYEGVSYE